jgi:hypothetical protein
VQSRRTDEKCIIFGIKSDGSDEEFVNVINVMYND